MMRILIVNKFLFPNGGSETYIFKLGEQFLKQGHEVQYFGMDHPDRIVGNAVQSYTSYMDFHISKWQKILYPFKMIYSFEAKRKIRLVLNDFKPDIVHLNNINFQITPSIIDEIKRWSRQKKRKLPVVYTAHDYQWVCPNHLMLIPSTQTTCFQCRNGQYWNCTKNKCIHNSFFRSLLGTLEAILYQKMKTYEKVDCIICPSRFLRDKLATNPVLQDKLKVLHNFINSNGYIPEEKKDYVIYFGRYSDEKGVKTLLQVCGMLKEIPFLFAGSGALKADVVACDNITDVGFQKGEKLQKLIAEARFSVFPSEWYENCPFSVIETQFYSTPVIAANIGGVPELMQDGITGDLFEPGNVEELKNKIFGLWNDPDRLQKYTDNCRDISICSTEEYCNQLTELCEETKLSSS